MRMLLLALALPLLAAGAGPQAPPTPEDEALFKDFNIKEAYEAMKELRPRIDALVKEVSAFRDSHAAKAEPDPGGARRREAHAELYALRHELYRRRDVFRHLGTDQRMPKAVLMAFRLKDGKSDEANRIFQTGFRHAQIVGESKDFERSLDVLLDEEEAAYQAAVGRWQAREDERVRNRRLAQAGGAVALLLPAGVLLRRRWRLRAPAALAAPSPADRLGRWGLAKAPKPWTYGTRWDGADGGAKTTASVRLFDERLCAPPASPEKLLLALAATAPAKHPGVAAPVESFAAGASVVLVYPAAAARPLSLWLEQGRAVPPAQAVAFLKRLAPALDAAHRAGRAHGGLGPDCVLVAADGAVLFEDFGVAVALAAAGTKAVASPAYAAPELAEGRLSAPADLYSLGVLLYELATGRHPFEGTNLRAMKQEKRYTPLSRLLRGCPPGLDALVDGLLEPDPARRRPAPGGLEDALRALG